MRDFKKLKIWQDGIQLVEQIYQLTNKFPREEKFGLTSQMTRAAVSIPSNIAEGGARNSQKEYKRFLEIALGSAFELETQLIITGRLGWMHEESSGELLNAVIEEQKMISGFIRQMKV